jgi:hypothetical protein
MRRLKRIRRTFARATAFVLVAVFSVVATGGHTLYAHVAVEGSEFLDALSHAPPTRNLGPGQVFRNWADDAVNPLTGSANPANPYCEIQVTDTHVLPDGPGGRPRIAYRFKVIGNADGRAHAFEAGGYADSSTGNCTSIYNNGWDGEWVNLNDSIFRNPVLNAEKTRPINVYLGVTNEQEDYSASRGDSIRQNVSDWSLYDMQYKRPAGIKPTSDGGAYGFIADAGGYQVNGQNIWCAGIDIGDLRNTPYNIQWPGNFDDAANDGCHWDFRFKAGTTEEGPGGGNYDTNWGAYARGAMGERNMDTPGIYGNAVRCWPTACPLGSSIPGIQRFPDGTVENFRLIVAGIKNHDGAGTYNGNPNINDPVFGSNVDSIAKRSPNPFKVPFAEAWLTMEYDPTPGSNPQVTLECNLVLSPGVPEPGQTFGVRLEYTYIGPPTTLSGTSQMISTGPVPPDPDLLQVKTGGPIAVTSTTPVQRYFDFGGYSGPAGEYSYTASVSTTSGLSDTCGGDFEIAAKPYFKVWTNDVKVGGGFKEEDGSCTVTGEATVIGYGGDDNTNTFRGASAELAVFALGEVRNYFSTSNRGSRGGAEPTPPHGWTFANAQLPGVSGNNPSPGDTNKVVDYGGKSGMSRCVDDWFDTVPDTAQNLPSNYFYTTAAGSGSEAAAVVATRNTGVFEIRSNPYGNVNRPRAIYVPNDTPVVITQDITANNGNTLYIIATGDIRIAKNVNLVDAVLISKSRVITCTEANGDLIASADLYAQCGGSGSSGKLTIRGAVIANEIKLLRTFGTRNNSVQDELYFDSTSFFNAAAEEIIFDPTLYRSPSALRTPAAAKTQIDFMTSLPPIL